MIGYVYRALKISGFTLIELLIVVAIIAILAAIAVPNFLEAQTRSKVSRCKADMRSTVTAIESYGVDNNKYPPAADFGIDAVVGFHSRVPTYLTTPIAYMTSVTFDPFVSQQTTFSNATYPPETHVGKRYVYYYTPYHLELATDLWNGLEEWVGQWLLYGYGPDRTPFQGPSATLLPYDPTNGTVSPGNIIRCQKNQDGINPHPVTKTFFWN